MHVEIQYQSLVPVILVNDFRSALVYYDHTFGFTVDYVYGDPPFYAGLSCGSVTINIREVHSQTGLLRHERSDTIDVYVQVSGIDELNEKLMRRGVKVISEIATRDYGMRDLAIEDINGYRWAFGEPIG